MKTILIILFSFIWINVNSQNAVKQTIFKVHSFYVDKTHYGVRIDQKFYIDKNNIVRSVPENAKILYNLETKTKYETWNDLFPNIDSLNKVKKDIKLSMYECFKIDSLKNKPIRSTFPDCY